MVTSIQKAIKRMVSSVIVKQSRHYPRVTQSFDVSMTRHENDFNLIRRITTGDENAVRELYAVYGQRLYSYALRLTNDPAAAEDVMQETLIAAWRTASTFRGDGRLIAWLLGIVHHSAMKTLRHMPQPLEVIEEKDISPTAQKYKKAGSSPAFSFIRAIPSLNRKY